MRRPRAGDERSSQALGRRRGSAWWPIRAARQELADGRVPPAARREHLTLNGHPQGAGETQEERQAQGAKTESAARRSKFRLRLWAKRNKTTANEPGQTKPVRVARREALSASSQEDADLEPTTAAPPGAPSPRIRRGEIKRRRTRRRKETGRRSFAFGVPGLLEK